MTYKKQATTEKSRVANPYQSLAYFYIIIKMKFVVSR